MWQKRQAELLAGEIEAILAPLYGQSGLYDLVKNPLAKAGQELAVKSGRSRPWPLLPLMVCEAVSGDCERALPAAAAIQLLRTAADVFDDIEDADSSESLSVRHGFAIAVNVATTLIIVAERELVRLETKGVEPRIIVRTMDAINSFHTVACAGQHLDISLTGETAVSEDMYFKVIGMKSAYAAECACHVGALLANANQELVDTFSAFGRNLGMAAQIANDIQGIMSGTDIIKHKITLPVIFALGQADGEAGGRLKGIFLEPATATWDPAPIRDLLFRTGAIHYATVKMEFYKQLASGALSEAAGAGASVERLKLFLE